jgi:hypothetical protein
VRTGSKLKLQITKFLPATSQKYAKKGRLHDFTIIDPAPKLDAPYPDLSYVQAHLAFKTDIALGTVLLNLVLTETGYKAWYIHTVLEGLIEFPPVERADGHMTGALSWSEQRAADSQFEGESPEVLIGKSRLAYHAVIEIVDTILLSLVGAGHKWAMRWLSIRTAY